MATETRFIRWFGELRLDDVDQVGGKNASLGELYQRLTGDGVRVPNGFAITADGYRHFMHTTGLADTVSSILDGLHVDDLAGLSQRGLAVRHAITGADLPADLQSAIVTAYEQLGNGQPVDVAVRSSATAEDLPGASFAGQQETYLNVRGRAALLEACRRSFASLFRRPAHGAIRSRRIRSDVHARHGKWLSGRGSDQRVVRPRRTDRPGIRHAGRILRLQAAAPAGSAADPPEDRRQQGVQAGLRRGWESWAKDGQTGELFIVQARPETVHAHTTPQQLEQYSLRARSRVLVSGRSVGSKIAAGPVRVIPNAADLRLFKAGDVLVTDKTDPDWEPIMKKAAAIVTNRGGRTCHAAIVSRELGVPAIVGTATATTNLADGQNVSVSCAEGETGFVYEGALPFDVERTSPAALAPTRTRIMMNVGNPDEAFALSFTPNDGVGLARLEFIINNSIGVHPMALVRYPQLTGEAEGFALECRALKKVREEMGLINVVIMVPFCRTVEEARLVTQELARNGLRRRDHGLELYMMVEIPSNVLLLPAFAEYFDGFSIGSNDLTQLTRGVDRDSAMVAHVFDERNPAVRALITQAIEHARRQGCRIGLCGQAPSDYPDFARFLVECGIDSMSLNPDAVVPTRTLVADVEAATRKRTAA